MPIPLTADERERRLIKYLTTCNRERLAEFKLSRLNRIAIFRKRLMELLNEMVETRAEDLAAGMMMEYAPDRPKREAVDVTENRLVIGPKKARMPVWLRSSERRRGRITG